MVFHLVMLVVSLAWVYDVADVGMGHDGCLGSHVDRDHGTSLLYRVIEIEYVIDSDYDVDTDEGVSERMSDEGMGIWIVRKRVAIDQRMVLLLMVIDDLDIDHDHGHGHGHDHGLFPSHAHAHDAYVASRPNQVEIGIQSVYDYDDDENGNENVKANEIETESEKMVGVKGMTQMFHHSFFPLVSRHYHLQQQFQQERLPQQEPWDRRVFVRLLPWLVEPSPWLHVPSLDPHS